VKQQHEEAELEDRPLDADLEEQSVDAALQEQSVDAVLEERGESATLQGSPIENDVVERAPGAEPQTMAELLADADREFAKVRDGDVVEARVERVDADEILVDIGGVTEGVVPAREMGGAAVVPGEIVVATVMRSAGPDGRAVLSLRRARRERRWREMQQKLESGEVIEAPVIEVNRGGLVVDVGMRGFIPLSQLSSPDEVASQLGRRLYVKVIEVNPQRDRLILSERIAQHEMRRRRKEAAARELNVGDVLTGRVTRVAPFGLFVDVGVAEGLVHRSELGWAKVASPAAHHVGEEVRVVVTSVDPDRGRISLSMKQLQEDPWARVGTELRVGDELDAVITKLMPFGAFARVREGLEGLIHISELAPHRVTGPEQVVSEGERRRVRIVGIDSERRRLSLSLRQVSGESATNGNGRASTTSGA
jgi:small subunit ribosomal protein S1